MIFIDRSIPRPVAEALQKVRDDVEWLESRFRDDSKEEEWLREAGRGEWLCITRDKKIQTRRGELQALINNGVDCFLIIQKQSLTKWGYLRLLAMTLDQMEEFFAATERSFLYGVGRTGIFRRVM
jgi:predicted nuclease of predicted toxin-antitoxin system